MGTRCGSLSLRVWTVPIPMHVCHPKPNPDQAKCWVLVNGVDLRVINLKSTN